jgi:citrate lyase subunit beta / citryl-CoA lyase
MSTAPIPLRRSVLYMPGANARALDKARGLAADTLILDLEDAVAPAAKTEARSQVAQALAQGGYGHRELVVRCNVLDSEWAQDDVAMTAASGAHALLIPKVESVAMLETACNWLAQHQRTDLPIWVMIETPRGVLNSAEIAAHPRVAALVMGTNDLAKELRVPQTLGREGFLTSLGLCVLAARAHGCDIIDGVYIQLDDEAGLHTSCEQGVALGFDGKTAIHPNQLATINTVFAPSNDAVEKAQAIVAAWDDAQRQGLGVVVVNGRLVEALHVIEAQRVLELRTAVIARNG